MSKTWDVIKREASEFPKVFTSIGEYISGKGSQGNNFLQRSARGVARAAGGTMRSMQKHPLLAVIAVGVAAWAGFKALFTGRNEEAPAQDAHMEDLARRYQQNQQLLEQSSQYEAMGRSAGIDYEADAARRQAAMQQRETAKSAGITPPQPGAGRA